MNDEVTTEPVKRRKKNSGHDQDNVVPITAGNPTKASALALDQSCLQAGWTEARGATHRQLRILVSLLARKG